MLEVKLHVFFVSKTWIFVVLDYYVLKFSKYRIPIYLMSCVFIVQFWKRKEKSTAMEWGTNNFETQEHDRPGQCFFTVSSAHASLFLKHFV